MLEAMERVAKAARETFGWVPNEEPMVLVMDNAGGHGTNGAIA